MSGSTTSPVGLFPLSYRIGNPIPGAPSLALNLLVYTPDQTVRGTSLITQAVNPPLELPSDVWGQYTYLTVMPPSTSKILVTAQGNQGGPSSNSIVTFKIQLVVDEDWQSGVANYQYYNGHQWVSVENVPAHLVGPVPSYTLQTHQETAPALQAYPPIHPLYAAPIHGAIASGDLAQMKTLASQATQQLEQLPQLRNALDAAKDEIGKLERR
ncbi:DUF1842 domain-containing protein [Pseudomonas chlororaphis]|uniref:DUF1842 domain-containing protein n=1 Tax=Pseudomonas chlororaphis TaxID=587753 RepID=UPI0006A62F6A|nr:DUF1842 domain-containing protein [Pseudomonas chlororaphis]AZC30160.1 hypothetical protein C4K38_2200 [Pseudomonas chlororaphis subsp. piscium]WDG79121.1 DUF1842 domain-containing protein [Pseudomonas chlororaphis]WDG87828.1 DUF1842 domain-containing protein [Pseudomonas chlororaphis]WDG94089.1 DUF1842 domain-containing protein [Pseudomonas chlororaphis]SDT23728.1 protein of unknown function [Pseudomonas chlororaphis]